jgi:hypothetical protein
MTLPFARDLGKPCGGCGDEPCVCRYGVIELRGLGRSDEEYDRVRVALSVFRVRVPMLLHDWGCPCRRCTYVLDTIEMAAEALGDADLRDRARRP